MQALTTDDVLRPVKFTSLNPNDPTVYIGTIAAIGVYTLATAANRDITSYNAAVRTVDNTVAQDPKTLKYFLVNITTQSGTVPQAFAFDWIADSAFSFTDTNATATVVITGSSTADLNAQLARMRASNITFTVQTSS